VNGASSLEAITKALGQELAKVIVKALLPELKAYIGSELASLAGQVAAPAQDQVEVRLSTTDAAQLAGKSRKTIVAWIRGGRLAATRPVGTREYFIKKADLEAFLSAGSPIKAGRSKDEEERVLRNLGL
jgi:excisionase family DNA binding protein